MVTIGTTTGTGQPVHAPGRASNGLAAFAIAALLAAGGPALAADRAGELKTFRDWVIGCDNTLACTALGMAPADGAGSAFVKIARAAGPAAAPEVSVVVYAETTPAAPRLRLRLDGGKGPGLPSDVFTAELDGDFVRARLTGSDAAAVIAALLPAKGLTVELLDGSKSLSSSPVSLSGSSASLRYMDAEQGRAGGVTALVATGSAAASKVPAAPAAPVVTAVAMSELSPPPKRRPAGIPAASADDCPIDPKEMAVTLAGDRTLWGVCVSAGAYNFTYEFWVAGAGKPQPARFEVPGAGAVMSMGEDDDYAALVNPGLSDDGMVLSAFSKGRGIGDCGGLAEFVFDGERFRALTYAAMDTCMGVPADDWPVLYTARRR
ncbi:DUF1176 domain-containing protein [Pseudoxanthobacter sp. M-2]|uniref:DUF1176 domain-containing protein n=1 Tax=Pseudoxanthobacter sp. M-2 TaxID=3078754 RepID=UPI0038FBF7C9